MTPTSRRIPTSSPVSSPGRSRSAISSRRRPASTRCRRYELSFRFYENGVSSRLYIDYGDFAIRGELKELTFLEEGKCEAGAPPDPIKR